MTAVIDPANDIPQMLNQWEKWALQPVPCVAGLPKRSVIAQIEDFHMSEYPEIPPRRGICRICGNEFPDLDRHYASKHPQHDPRTAKGVQTKAPVFVNPDDNPVAERVEAAIVFMGETRPDLYHVLVADRLWLVPVYSNTWDKQRFRNPKDFRYIPRRFNQGEKEAEHKARLAQALGMGKTRYYDLMTNAFTLLGCYLELDKRYEIVPA